MKISGITGTGGNIQSQGTGMNAGTDAVSKNIQQQIAYAQQQLQQLSSNKNMTPEEKMKKRQEIQQEIANLNQQLRQHQIEQKRQQQAAQSQGYSDNREENTEKAKGRGLSQTGMEAMISADTSIKQAKTQSGVATRLEGKAKVLESEIKMDAGRGGNVAKKQEELSELKQRAQSASMAQMSMLADANRTMAEASETDTQQPVQEKQDEEGKDGVKADNGHTREEQNDSEKGPIPENYKSVNVLL